MLHLAFSARAGTSAATQQVDSAHLLAKSEKRGTEQKSFNAEERPSEVEDLARTQVMEADQQLRET